MDKPFEAQFPESQTTTDPEWYNTYCDAFYDEDEDPLAVIQRLVSEGQATVQEIFDYFGTLDIMLAQDALIAIGIPAQEILDKILPPDCDITKLEEAHSIIRFILKHIESLGYDKAQLKNLISHGVATNALATSTILELNGPILDHDEYVELTKDMPDETYVLLATRLMEQGFVIDIERLYRGLERGQFLLTSDDFIELMKKIGLGERLAKTIHNPAVLKEMLAVISPKINENEKLFALAALPKLDDHDLMEYSVARTARYAGYLTEDIIQRVESLALSEGRTGVPSLLRRETF